MSFFDNLWNLITTNPLTAFNTVLIGVTIGFAFQTQIFQKRTVMREAIEQLDDHAVSNFKLKPILMGFSFWKRQVRVAFQVLEPINANVSQYTPIHRDFSDEHAEYFETELSRINGVDRVKVTEDQSEAGKTQHFILIIDSINPEQVRDKIEAAYFVINTSYWKIGSGSCDDVPEW